MQISYKKIAWAAGIFIFVILLFVICKRYVSLSLIKMYSAQLALYKENHFFTSSFIFTLITMATTAFGLPVIALCALLGGYLFGVTIGGFYTLVAAVTGSMLNFLVCSYYMEQLIPHRPQQLHRFNDLIHYYGPSYLLVMQFLLIVPSFVITAVAVIARVSSFTFFWTTCLGFAPTIFIYAFAGQQLGSVQSISDILSKPVLIAFALLIFLALLPIFARFLQNKFHRQDHRHHNKDDQEQEENNHLQ